MTSLTLKSPNSLSEAERLRLRELLRQKRARTAAASLTEYVKQIEIPGAPVLDEDEQETGDFYPENLTPADHHELLIDKLEAIERGELKRLMVFMPPGSAKSTYATVAFPTWYMGKKRNRSVGSFSYGDVLCRQFGARCQQLAMQEHYREIFGAWLPRKRAASLEWAIDNGSHYFASGILGGITGRRLDGAVIDDP